MKRSVDLHGSAHLHQGIISRTWTIRSRLPKASDGTIHERGKLVLQVLVTSRNKNRNSGKYGKIVFFTLLCWSFAHFLFHFALKTPAKRLRPYFSKVPVLKFSTKTSLDFNKRFTISSYHNQKKNRKGFTRLKMIQASRHRIDSVAWKKSESCGRPI